MRIDFSLYDRFFIVPKFWKQKGSHTGEAAKYWGHTWSFTIHWLWFELLVYGET